MNFANAITPRETEEIKPGLFIQKRYGKGGKIHYRQIHPAAWNGKINWRNLIIGPNFWKNFIWFLIIMFIVFSYWHDTNELKEFYYKVQRYKMAWCSGVPVEYLGKGGEYGYNLTLQNYFNRST